ncbi:alpha/beta fold hydrolase [Pseudonocardia acaciae]|uniref:alpha/beta fold hydrolase n=1 Tax=Pseudonocardia acaciae TaxID=551276 RepID=UPI00048BA191|nr:alpha/beta fold hydrolase [Pseudonocardia acaciae]
METVSYRRPGLVVREHLLTVPLDHGEPDGESIEVFARELVAAGREHERLPWLLWLQGGPGGRADRPAGPVSGWLARALREFRVVLLDQRGTGRSTPATRQTVPARGDAPAQAAYLAHFRADAIVRDAELLRRELAGAEARWTLLGQSYGGFCVLAYLSLAPEGVREALVAGGLPALDGGPDPVYRATYPQVAALCEAYFERYPSDRPRAADIARHLGDEEERLPTGEVLTARRFQTLGNDLGNRAKFDGLHALLEDPFVTVGGARRLSDAFLHGLSGAVSFATRPLYAVIHEPIYCQGSASRWSAHRIRDEQGGRFEPDADPFLFTGEMVYPWMFDEDPSLVPLRGAAELLAAKDGWPRLYDPDRLAANQVPVAAAIYVDDMYVPFEPSLATARRVGALRPWITNEYHHDGIREDGATVLDKLLSLVRS